VCWLTSSLALEIDSSDLVQVAILIALAIALGVIFKSEITQFVNDVFSKLKA